MGEVDTIFHRLSFEELGNVYDHSEKNTGENVEEGTVLLLLQPVMWFCDCQETLDRDRDDNEDGTTETQPIKWVVENGKYAEKVVRIKFLVVVSHHIEDCKDNVESVEAV